MKCPHCGQDDFRLIGHHLICLPCSMNLVPDPQSVLPETPRDESQEERNNAAYKRWKKAVRQRDSNTCQFPGCPGKSQKLETHHIRRWSSDLSLRYDVCNGIVLCYDCHHAIQDKEEEYADCLGAIALANMRADPRLAVLEQRFGEDDGQV